MTARRIHYEKIHAVVGIVPLVIGVCLFFYIKSKHSADIFSSSDMAMEVASIRKVGKAAGFILSAIEKHKRGEYFEAITDIDEAIRLTPEDAYLYFIRGLSKRKLGHHSAAIQDYNETIRLEPKAAAAYYERGFTKSYLGRYSKAIDDPIFVDFDLHLKLNKNKTFEEAITDFDEVIRLNDRALIIYKISGGDDEMLSLDNQAIVEEAIADFDEAIRLNPKYAEAYSQRGFAKYRIMHPLKAIFTKKEDSPLKFIFVDTTQKIKDKDKLYFEVLADYNKAIRLDPNIPYIYEMRGQLKQDMGHKSQAQKDFDTSNKLIDNSNNKPKGKTH